MRPARLLACLCLATAISACAQFPELDAALTEEAKTAPSPELVDNRLLLGDAAAATIDAETRAEIEARAAGLQGQQAVLGEPVISAEDAALLQTRAESLRAQSTLVAPEEGTR